MNRETRRRSEVTLINTREPIEVSQRSVEGWGERPHPAVGLVKSTEQPCKGRRVNGPTENMEVRRRVEEEEESGTVRTYYGNRYSFVIPSP